jgi:hypothetical protein
MTETQQQVIQWFATGEKGLSSECMALWLSFDQRTGDLYHPRDPADLNRCLLLLQAAPGLRSDLSRMAMVSEGWAKLIARWEEMEALFLDEVGLNWTKGSIAPRTYAFMLEVLR